MGPSFLPNYGRDIFVDPTPAIYCKNNKKRLLLSLANIPKAPTYAIKTQNVFHTNEEIAKSLLGEKCLGQW